MDETQVSEQAKSSFEDALRRGEATGYAVCTKPMRFAKLPDVIAASFAEIGGENCYYVFESEADANAKLDGIPSAERLGCLMTVRKVRYLRELGPRDGPRLDATGHPFHMKGFIVDRRGTVSAWTHSGRLGWREEMPPGDAAPEPSVQRMPGFWRRLLEP